MVELCEYDVRLDILKMLTLLSLVMDSSGLLKATAPTGGPTEFKPQSQKPVTVRRALQFSTVSAKGA